MFVAAAIAAVCSDTGCHNCQMRLPSSLQNWDVDVTLKEQTPAPPIFLIAENKGLEEPVESNTNIMVLFPYARPIQVLR